MLDSVWRGVLSVLAVVGWFRLRVVLGIGGLFWYVSNRTWPVVCHKPLSNPNRNIDGGLDAIGFVIGGLLHLWWLLLGV